MTRLSSVCILILTGVLIASVGCRSTTSPEQSPDAGVFLPSGAGSTWVYTMAAGNTTYRTMLGDTVLEGRIYHILQDSVTFLPPNNSTSFVSQSYFRSDENSLYEVLSLPVREGIFLDTRIGASWTEISDTTANPNARRWEYTTIALLPSFTAGGHTYSDVLQLELWEYYPGIPNAQPTMYEFYYAKNIGMVELMDSTHRGVAQVLSEYHIQ
ncbi:MAG: hypothetical protein JSS75_10950 [Bacteroidetes bacterium]|nr:hypothetical protein [Bacteroidota bacterium]